MGRAEGKDTLRLLQGTAAALGYLQSLTTGLVKPSYDDQMAAP